VKLSIALSTLVLTLMTVSAESAYAQQCPFGCSAELGDIMGTKVWRVSCSVKRDGAILVLLQSRAGAQ
jgi:hypothetical protein